jgi:hypothetical protein
MLPSVKPRKRGGGGTAPPAAEDGSPNFARHLKELSDPGRGQILQRTGEKRRIRYRFASPILRPYIIMRGFGERIITKTMLKKISEG